MTTRATGVNIGGLCLYKGQNMSKDELYTKAIHRSNSTNTIFEIFRSYEIKMQI